MGSDIGIQGAKFILSNMPGGLINNLNVSINTKSEIYDFVNSFDQIIDKVSNYLKVDGIFEKLFKKANYFYFHLEHLKKVEKLNARSLNVCVENQLNNLQLIEIYFWANDNFLKLKNCGQKSNLELTELCRKHELPLRKSIVNIFGETPNKSLIQKINDYSVKQKSLFNNILQHRFSKLSFKSSNGLKSYMQSDISIQGVIFLLSNSESELRNIRNIGVSAIAEINDFINSLLELIDTVSNCPDEEDIDIQLFNSFLIQKFSLSQTILDGLRKDSYFLIPH